MSNGYSGERRDEINTRAKANWNRARDDERLKKRLSLLQFTSSFRLELQTRFPALPLSFKCFRRAYPFLHKNTYIARPEHFWACALSRSRVRKTSRGQEDCQAPMLWFKAAIFIFKKSHFYRYHVHYEFIPSCIPKIPEPSSHNPGSLLLLSHCPFPWVINYFQNDYNCCSLRPYPTATDCATCLSARLDFSPHTEPYIAYISPSIKKK